MEVQPCRSATFWWILEADGDDLQTSYVLNGQRLTDELLATIFCVTQQLLNARPLTPISSDPSDLEAVKSNLLFLGQPSIAIPYLPDAQKYQFQRKMFRVAQSHMDNIWSRSMKEYLSVHNILQNWYKERPHLKDHDLVWIVDDREKTGVLPPWKCKTVPIRERWQYSIL